MTEDYVPKGKITRLTPSDYEASSEAGLKNINGQAFRDWPNEAGVSRLVPFSPPSLPESHCLV